GFFDDLERQSIDLRSKYAWWTPRPMSSEICHVDIDDGAVQSVGRWPWDRSKLADVIVELRRAGARTVALDLMFSEPQPPRWLEVDREALGQFKVGRLETVCPESEPKPAAGTTKSPGQPPPCFVLIDHDAVFATALRADSRDAPAQCVLSVKPSEVLEQNEQW